MKVWTVLCTLGKDVALAHGDPNNKSPDSLYFYESLNELVEVLKKQDIFMSTVKLYRYQCKSSMDRFWIEEVDIGDI